MLGVFEMWSDTDRARQTPFEVRDPHSNLTT